MSDGCVERKAERERASRTGLSVALVLLVSPACAVLACAAVVYRLARFKNRPRKPSRVAIETTKGVV
jgi:hypothetical protein